jgi:GAF domain-containing protein
MSKTKAELLRDNQRLRKRVASLERAMDQRTVASKESEELRLVLAEAREQQTATSEILRVISSSPTDDRPVFEAIVRSAVRLCGGVHGGVLRLSDDVLSVVAHENLSAISADMLLSVYPTSPDRAGLVGLAIRQRDVIHSPDVERDPRIAHPELARRAGYSSVLAVPILRSSEPIGAIFVTSTTPFAALQMELLKTFADQAVIAIENVRLFKELEARNRELSEALEQQTATSEILDVISHSPTDVQPVFNAIAECAARLCDAAFSAVVRFDGELLHLVAVSNMLPEERAAYHSLFPRRPQLSFVMGRALLDGRSVHIEDVETDPDYDPRTLAELKAAAPYHTCLGIPILRDGLPIGAIGCARHEVKPFTAAQIELVKTFANQAVIAIENVRLFNETKEALERQTATSEILRIIASSPTHLQPVLDAMAESAARLCSAYDASIFQLDGDVLRLVAHHGPVRVPPGFVMSAVRGLVGGRAVLDRQPIQVADLQTQTEEFPEGSAIAREHGFHTLLSVPLLSEGAAIGIIALRRIEVQPFTETQIALLQTFADQAVIAIENVRLFNELQEKNRALTEAHAQVTEALDQQTATSEILRVISSSPTALEPVAQTIADSAGRLCNCAYSAVFRFDGELIHWLAARGASGVQVEALRGVWPRVPDRETLVGRTILARETLHFHDAASDPTHAASLPTARAALAIRSWLGVPIVREGEPIGVIALVRLEVRPFSEQEIALVQTFADQAVIAIENVRLFTELQASNRELTTALDQQTATGEILGVISSSPTDVQPVFDTIVRSAMRLLRGRAVTVRRLLGDELVLAAYSTTTDSGDELARSRSRILLTEEPALSQVVHGRVPHIVSDTETDPTLGSKSREQARARGFRSLLVVPLLRENNVIGTLGVGRREPGPFTDDQVALLKTFADQAVIAIENVRLFTELQASNRDLTTALDKQTATSDILRVISQSQTDVQPVFDAIVGSAVRLLTGSSGGLTRVAGDQIALVALMSTDDAGDAALRAFYPRPLQSAQGMHGLVIRDRAPLNVADAHTDPRLSEAAQTIARARGVRSQVAVPLLRRDEAIGALAVNRREPGGFTDDEIALLQTFADQAVIAIENVRLFTELQEKNRALTEAHAQVTESLEQQTATSELLKVIGRSTFDLQPVFQTLAENAVRLCEAGNAAIFRFDGQVLRIAAAHNDSGDVSPVERELLERYPISLGRHSGAARAALERRTIHIHDIHSDPDYTWRTLRAPEPIRTVLALPILRANELLGAIVIYRREVRPFTDSHIALMETFADQAAIAIENVRLFTELRARTQELTRSVGQLTALGEVGRAVSSTLDLETVLTTIVSQAVQLSGLDGGVVFEYDEAAEEFLQRVATETGGTLAEVRRTARFRKGEGVLGRTALTLEPVQVPDITIPAPTRVDCERTSLNPASGRSWLYRWSARTD